MLLQNTLINCATDSIVISNELGVIVFDLCKTPKTDIYFVNTIAKALKIKFTIKSPGVIYSFLNLFVYDLSTTTAGATSTASFTTTTLKPTTTIASTTTSFTTTTAPLTTTFSFATTTAPSTTTAKSTTAS